MFMQAYRSGHNEAVLKTVWAQAHGGSNPSACAIQKALSLADGAFCIVVERREHLLCRMVAQDGVRIRARRGVKLACKTEGAGIYNPSVGEFVFISRF